MIYFKGKLMEDISNRTLAILVVIAILATILGIFTSPGGQFPLLGSVTNSTVGTANVTIITVTQIRLLNNTIDFGTGFVNSTSNFCTLQSDTSFQVGGCQGFNSPAKDLYFLVENAGNVNVTLTVNGTFATPRDFLCNPLDAQRNCTSFEPQYNWSTQAYYVGCVGVAAPATFSRVMNTSAQTVCTDFGFGSSNKIDVRLLIVLPRDSRIGTLNDSVLFTATS